MKIDCEKSEKSEILLLYLENKMIWFDGNSDSWRLTSLGKKIVYISRILAFTKICLIGVGCVSSNLNVAIRFQLRMKNLRKITRNLHQ